MAPITSKFLLQYLRLQLALLSSRKSLPTPTESCLKARFLRSVHHPVLRAYLISLHSHFRCKVYKESPPSKSITYSDFRPVRRPIDEVKLGSAYSLAGIEREVVESIAAPVWQSRSEIGVLFVSKTALRL